MGLRPNFSGMMGNVSKRQKPYFFLSMSSGISSSTTWPTAEEMTHSSFSYQSPFLGTFPRARARSAATDGFSAMTRDFMGCERVGSEGGKRKRDFLRPAREAVYLTG